MGVAKNAVFKGFVCYLIGTLLAYLSPIPYAYANPVGGNVSAGSAIISTSGNTETITQKSQNAVIDWSAFNIGGKETTRFVDPNSSSLTVNRVHDLNPSQILGTLSANGNLVLINPNGVFFGQGSKVDVNGIIATTSDVKNSEVMAGGKIHFTPGGNPNASVENEGTITAKDAGLVGLVAPNVQNNGVITAKLGKVHLASGDSFTLDLYGDKLLEIGVSDAVKQQLVLNTGAIEADGGTVKLTAAAGRSIVNSLIDVEGEIHAPAIQEHNGTISIYAEGSNAVQGNVAANKAKKQGTSTVLVSGKLDASGKQAGQTGGSISVLGDHVGILSGALIDASGHAGGGSIKIGGDLHGQGTLPAALNTIVQSGALIEADALTTGNGGNVAVWSDNYTNFAGTIQAKGGPNGGKGGFVETSGHQLLSLTDANGNNGSVDASAPKGIAGTWLLDPADVTICSTTGNCPSGVAADNGVQGSPAYTPNGSQAESQILASEIVVSLNAGTNVTITTGGDAASGTGGGSITVASNIAKTAGADATLTLQAASDIIVNSNVVISSTNNKLNVVLDSAHVASGAGTSGAIVMNAGSRITSNGGNITLGGGSDPTQFAAMGDAANADGIYLRTTTLSAGGGNISLIGTGFGATGNGIEGNFNDPITTTGSGTITLTGTGSNHGIVSSDDNFIAANGNITITGNIGGLDFTGYSVGSHIGYITSSGSGNILIIGSNSNAGFAAGVGITDQAYINSTGTGKITLQGTSTAVSGGSNYGIRLNNGDTITSATGDILLQGTGNGLAGSQDINFFDGAIITSTGSANITLQGLTNRGLNMQGVGAGAATNTIGGGSDTGNITFIADSLAGWAFTTAQTTGKVSFAPNTANTTVGVAGGGGTLQITSSAGGVLQSITAGSISIGSTSGTGNMDIDAYTWNAPVTFQSSTGNMAFESGTHSSGSNAFLADTGGSITLASGAAISSTASGNAIVLAAGGNFVNNSGSSSPLSASSGRWIVYSTKASSDTSGASVMNPAQAIYNETYASEAPGSVPNAGQNTWLYSTGLITITASGQTVTYGTAPNTSAVLGTTYSFSCSNGCSSSAVTGGPTLTISGSNGTSTSGNYNVGSWTITPSGVTVSNGDSISYVTGTLTVSAKSLTISGMIAAGKTYDTTNTATVNNGSDALVGKVSGDAVTLGGTGNTSGTFSSANAGTWTVTGSGLSIGGADAGNYTIAAQPTATATISPAGLTVTASNVSGTYGTSGANTLNGSTGFSSSGLLGGQTIGSVTLSTNATSSTSGNYNANTGINPASWTITPSGATGGTFNPNNYSIAYDIGTQTITPAGITISGMTASNKTYDTTTAATVNNGADVLNGVVAGHNNGGGTGDAVTLNTSSTATFSSANAGTWTVTGSGFSLSGADKGNYTLTQPALSATITPAPLSVTADNQSMTQYGSLPPLTATITGFVGGLTLTTSGVTGTAALSTPATTTSAVGSYNIAAALGTLAASNYDFTTFNSGVFTINAVPGTGGGHVLAPTPVFVAPGVQAPAPVAATPAPAPAAPIPAALSVPGTVQQETAKTANVTYALMPQPVVPTGSDVQLASYYSLMQLGAIPVTPAPTHNATSAQAGAPIAATSNGTVTETQAPDGTNAAPAPTLDNPVDDHKKKGD